MSGRRRGAEWKRPGASDTSSKSHDPRNDVRRKYPVQEITMIHLGILFSAQLVRSSFVGAGPPRSFETSDRRIGRLLKIEMLSDPRFARIVAFDRVLRLSQASTRPSLASAIRPRGPRRHGADLKVPVAGSGRLLLHGVYAIRISPPIGSAMSSSKTGDVGEARKSLHCFLRRHPARKSRGAAPLARSRVAAELSYSPQF